LLLILTTCPYRLILRLYKSHYIVTYTRFP
jgi:hypothetical protein